MDNIVIFELEDKSVVAKFATVAIEKLGSPEAVAEYKKKQEEEFAILRAEREEMLKKKKAEHEAYLRRIGVID